MVHTWVISPTYKWLIPWSFQPTDPSTFDPNFLGHPSRVHAHTWDPALFHRENGGGKPFKSGFQGHIHLLSRGYFLGISSPFKRSSLGKIAVFGALHPTNAPQVQQSESKYLSLVKWKAKSQGQMHSLLNIWWCTSALPKQSWTNSSCTLVQRLQEVSPSIVCLYLRFPPHDAVSADAISLAFCCTP